MENQSSETAVTEEGRISIYVGMKEEADRRGISYAQICREKGMKPSTFYHGMSRHGMGVSEVKGCEKSEVSARRIVPDPVMTDGVAVSLVISGHEVTVRSSAAALVSVLEAVKNV